MWQPHQENIEYLLNNTSIGSTIICSRNSILPKCFLQTCVQSSPCTVEPRNNMWALLAIKWRFCHSFRTDGDSVNTCVLVELRVVSFESFFKRIRISFVNWINFGNNSDPRERNGSRPDGQRTFQHMGDCSVIYLYNLYLLCTCIVCTVLCIVAFMYIYIYMYTIWILCLLDRASSW